MYLIFLTCLIFSISASDFCFDEAFNQTTQSSCTFIGTYANQCTWPVDFGDGYIKIQMRCDGSEFYDLPLGIDGDDTFDTEFLLRRAMQNLSTTFNITINVNCATRSYFKLFDVYCKGGRSYLELTCNTTAPQNETLPEFPPDFICAGTHISLAFLIGFVYMFVVGH